MINIDNKKTKIIIFAVMVLFFISPILFFINYNEEKENVKEDSSISLNIGNDHYAIDDVAVLSEKNFTGEDFFSISKKLVIDKRLKGNLFAIGELVTIEEDILNDVKIVADKVVLSSSIYGSLITLNNSTYIKKDAFIEEDFVFIGEDLVFSGQTQGNLIFIGNNITITDTAKIGGKLTIKGKNQKISSAAYINETISFDKEIGKYINSGEKDTLDLVFVFLKGLSLVAFGILIGLLFNNRKRWSLWSFVRHHPICSMCTGILSLVIFIPLVVFLFIINWFVGLVTLFLFFGLFALSAICLIITIADIFYLCIKKDFHFALYTTVAVVVMAALFKTLLLVFIPIIGWIFVLGATINKLFKKCF